MNNKLRQTILFILLLVVLYFFNTIGRYFGHYNNFIITGLLNFILTYYLLKINPFKKMGLSLIFFPFILLSLTIIYGIFYNLKMPGIIGFYIYILSTFFGILLFTRSEKKTIIIVYSTLYIISVFNYNNMYNYYDSIIDKNINIGKKMPLIKIFDKNLEKQFVINGNKILVIDLWANSCSNCITAFPKFEKLKNYYANDMEVEIFAVNIYNSKTDIKQSEKLLKDYSFKNYYSDVSVFDKLNFNSVPNYIIIGKDGKIKYFGNLNMDANETYNNIYELIENEK